jgi:predicted RecB family endonuclease
MFKFALLWNLEKKVKHIMTSIDDLNIAVGENIKRIVRELIRLAVIDIQKLTADITAAVISNDTAAIEAAVTSPNASAAVNPPAA